MENLDIAEYAKVDSFKKELGKLGVLHHTFRSSDDLEKILDVALARVVEESSNSVSSENSSINVSEVLVDRDDDSEMGYFELLDRGQESMSRCSALLQKIGELLTEMGAATESHTAEMISKKDKNGKIPQQIARIETDKACGDIEKFTKYATPLLDEALSRFEESFTAYSSVLVMEQTAGFTQDPEETARFKEAQHSLIESLNVADNGMASLAAVFNGMIKFSVRFGHARRDLLRFISRFQSANSRIRSLCFNLLGIAEAIHASSTKRISTSE